MAAWQSNNTVTFKSQTHKLESNSLSNWSVGNRLWLTFKSHTLQSNNTLWSTFKSHTLQSNNRLWSTFISHTQQSNNRLWLTVKSHTQQSNYKLWLTFKSHTLQSNNTLWSTFKSPQNHTLEARLWNPTYREVNWHNKLNYVTYFWCNKNYFSFKSRCTITCKQLQLLGHTQCILLYGVGEKLSTHSMHFVIQGLEKNEMLIL